jgi:hypothetical protein
MEEKCGSFAELAQTYSAIFTSETRSNISLEDNKKKYLSIKWLGEGNRRLYTTK